MPKREREVMIIEDDDDDDEAQVVSETVSPERSVREARRREKRLRKVRLFRAWAVVHLLTLDVFVHRLRMSCPWKKSERMGMMVRDLRCVLMCAVIRIALTVSPQASMISDDGASNDARRANAQVGGDREIFFIDLGGNRRATVKIFKGTSVISCPCGFRC